MGNFLFRVGVYLDCLEMVRVNEAKENGVQRLLLDYLTQPEAFMVHNVRIKLEYVVVPQHSCLQVLILASWSNPTKKG